MSLNMKLNHKSKNIKRAKAGKPNNNFNNFKNRKHKKEKISSVKIYPDTLTKVRFIQRVLGYYTHEQVLRRLINKDLVRVCKSHNISEKDEKTGLKFLSRK